MNDMEKIVGAIEALAAIYGKSLSPAAIAMYASDLLEVGADKALPALEVCRRKMRSFPTIADVLAEIPGAVVDELDVARDIGNRIWDAIGRFGWTNQARAQEFLGEMGWSVVERMGGWQNLCTMDSEERGTFVAQARDFAMSRMRLERAGHGAGGYKIPSPESPSALPGRDVAALAESSTRRLS